MFRCKIVYSLLTKNRNKLNITESGNKLVITSEYISSVNKLMGAFTRKFFNKNFCLSKRLYLFVLFPFKKRIQMRNQQKSSKNRKNLEQNYLGKYLKFRAKTAWGKSKRSNIALKIRPMGLTEKSPFVLLPLQSPFVLFQLNSFLIYFN